MTVDELAQSIDVSRRQVHRYWRGDAVMPLWVAVGLADALGVDLAKVLRRSRG